MKLTENTEPNVNRKQLRKLESLTWNVLKLLTRADSVLAYAMKEQR